MALFIKMTLTQFPSSGRVDSVIILNITRGSPTIDPYTMRWNSLPTNHRSEI
jgi:hypothetical protein